jgi:hypothetical protein
MSIHTFAPTLSGVFGVSNAREWIYIGESDNIRASLIDLLRDANTPSMKMQPTGFVFEICDPARRAARQNRLVLEYGPVCNQTNRAFSRG